eukprot:15433155-Alexandrium_andersonii.AAC.1
MSCREADFSLQLSRRELGSAAASFASQWRARWLAVEDEPSDVGGHTADQSGGSQQLPDSARCSHSDSKTDQQVSVPTDAKDRGRARRKAQKEAGQEHVVQKRK